MTTEAADTSAAPKGTWRLETPNGSMNPRSALDVLVDLNDKVTTGKVDHCYYVYFDRHTHKFLEAREHKTLVMSPRTKTIVDLARTKISAPLETVDIEGDLQ